MSPPFISVHPSPSCSSRGFGFVTFLNQDSALAVLRDAGKHRIQERPVEVKAAEPKPCVGKADHSVDEA